MREIQLKRRGPVKNFSNI